MQVFAKARNECLQSEHLYGFISTVSPCYPFLVKVWGVGDAFSNMVCDHLSVCLSSPLSNSLFKL